MNYTIAIADDHEMFRKGLIEIIGHLDNYSVIAEGSNGKELLDAITENVPDIVIVDLRMPVMDGFELIGAISERHPEVKMIALSMYNQDKFIAHALKLGVHGYLRKNHGPKELEDALQQVISEGFYFTKHVSAIMAKGMRTMKNKPDFVEIDLSTRERQILSLICEGLTNKDIGEQIFLSKRTVEGHRKNLIEKAGVKNTAELIAWSFRNNLVN